MANWVFMVCGWLLAGLAGALTVRFNLGRRARPSRRNDSKRVDWRISAPYFLGLMLAVLGGAGLQQRSFGLWAVPLALVPFVVAYAVPVQLHNAGVRPAQLS